MQTNRRQNYNSGSDFVLEYGHLRFTFNEEDFAQRCKQAAIRLKFVDGTLNELELEDLLNLTVNGEVLTPASSLGEYINNNWPLITQPKDKSLVHWLRRVIFRTAWLDQRVLEGELQLQLCTETFKFNYIDPDDQEIVEVSAEPSWSWLAYTS